MSDPSIAIQEAVTVLLRGLGTDAGERVYNVIPDKPAYPYIQVWPGYVSPIDEMCWDRSDVTMQIDVWATKQTYQSIKSIAAAIRSALHEQEVAVDGFEVDRIRIESVTFSDPLPHYRARISLSVEAQPA